MTFKVQDTCRLDNSGLLAVDAVKSDIKGRFIAFVPAAGAASRYFKPLDALRESLETESVRSLNKVCDDLRNQGALGWALPDALRNLISETNLNFLSEEDRTEALRWLDAPKALLPHHLNKESFPNGKIWRTRSSFFCRWSGVCHS